jgi:hypothetical protein
VAYFFTGMWYNFRVALTFIEVFKKILRSKTLVFISTPRPAWSVTKKSIKKVANLQISTHTPRVERDLYIKRYAQLEFISTHTPRVERDIIL